METKVKLSDGKPCRIRQLGIFELDNVAPSEKMGPFFYTMEMVDGNKVEDVYDLAALEVAPPKPKTPREDAEKGSSEWKSWLEWETYRAALAHYENQHVVTEEYNEAVLQYIVDMSMVNKSDITRIVTPEDWETVYTAALVPEVDENIIAEVLERNFKAQYQNKPVLDALQGVDGGAGGYLAVKKWESELMLRLQFSEEEYSEIPVMERARKIVAMKLDDWMSILEHDRLDAEYKKKGGKR